MKGVTLILAVAICQILFIAAFGGCARNGAPAACMCMADYALYRLSDCKVLLSAGVIEGAKLDDRYIQGDMMGGEHWIKTAAEVFSNQFKARVQGQMQRALLQR